MSYATARIRAVIPSPTTQQKEVNEMSEEETAAEPEEEAPEEGGEPEEGEAEASE